METFRIDPESNVRTRADALFHAEYAAIHALLPLARIEHVGATAVPELLTKGDLDIAVMVSDQDFDNAALALSTRYAANEGSDRTPTFAAFKDDSTDPPLGVQLVAEGSQDDMFVRFRDKLLADSTLVQQLNSLKRFHDGLPMDTYRTAKSAFIDAALSRR